MLHIHLDVVMCELVMTWLVSWSRHHQLVAASLSDWLPISLPALRWLQYCGFKASILYTLSVSLKLQIKLEITIQVYCSFFCPFKFIIFKSNPEVNYSNPYANTEPWRGVIRHNGSSRSSFALILIWTGSSMIAGSHLSKSFILPGQGLKLKTSLGQYISTKLATYQLLKPTLRVQA